MTAGLVKFSLAISSMFSCWRDALVLDDVGDVRDRHSRGADSGANLAFDLPHAAFVAAAFEFRADEGVEDFFAASGAAGFAARQSDVRVVVLARHGARSSIGR
jgi:hypothetical protein